MTLDEAMKKIEILERVQAAYIKESEAILQVLGKALGYPKDDDANFPDATGRMASAWAEAMSEEAAYKITHLTAVAGRYSEAYIDCVNAIIDMNIELERLEKAILKVAFSPYPAHGNGFIIQATGVDLLLAEQGRLQLEPRP